MISIVNSSENIREGNENDDDYSNQSSDSSRKNFLEFELSRPERRNSAYSMESVNFTVISDQSQNNSRRGSYLG